MTVEHRPLEKPSSDDYEILAQQVSALTAATSDVGRRLARQEARMDEVEVVTARLEAAALNTARALEEISRHWHAMYEAMRREEPGGVAVRRQDDPE